MDEVRRSLSSRARVMTTWGTPGITHGLLYEHEDAERFAPYRETLEDEVTCEQKVDLAELHATQEGVDPKVVERYAKDMMKGKDQDLPLIVTWRRTRRLKMVAMTLSINK